MEDNSLNGRGHKSKSSRLGRPPIIERVIEEPTEELLAIRREIAREVVKEMFVEMFGEDIILDSDKSIPDLLRTLANKMENR